MRDGNNLPFFSLDAALSCSHEKWDMKTGGGDSRELGDGGGLDEMGFVLLPRARELPIGGNNERD